MQRSVFIVLFSIQDLHCDVSKHACSGKISMSNGHTGNGQKLCSAINPGFSFKGMVAVHESTEGAMSDMLQSVRRKLKILDVEVS